MVDIPIQILTKLCNSTQNNAASLRDFAGDPHFAGCSEELENRAKELEDLVVQIEKQIEGGSGEVTP